jgi:dolichol-phosphate mannosyltransferase
LFSKPFIVIPTYNEEENIKETINVILEHQPDVSILVVDDCSVDETQEIVKKLQKENANIHLLVRENKKRGYAPSLIDGFKYALAAGADAVFQMDADMSHHPKYLPQLVAKLENADVVCGSRWVPGGGTENWPAKRVFLSKNASRYVRLILGLRLGDCTAGWVGYKKAILGKIDLDKIKSEGYGFNIEIKYRAKQAGAKFAEVPIVFIDRRFGHSKLSKRIIWEAIWVPWKLLFKNK